MKTRFFWLIIVLFVMESCLQYPRNINNKAREYLAFYKPFDTIFYENSKSSVDTFLITTVDSETTVHNSLGIMSPAPGKSITVHYTALSPYERTMKGRDLTYDRNNDWYFIALRILRYDSMPIMDFGFIGFNYTFHQDSIGVLKTDTLLIDGKIFNKYRYFELPKDNWINNPTQIVAIWWQNKYGLIAYKWQNGDMWKRINLK